MLNGKNSSNFYKQLIRINNIYNKNDKSEFSNSIIYLQKSNNSFIFEKKSLFLYNKKGNLLFSDPNNDKSYSIHNNFSTIINNIIVILNKNKKNKKMNDININIFFLDNIDKIVFVDIEKVNIISIGIFSIKTKTVIIKFYLLSFMITFINYLQERAIFNTDKIINNNIYIDIYKSFLFMPFNKYFEFLSRNIFKRQKLKFKNIFYKTYYLIELNSDKIIFSLQSLYNMNNGQGESNYQLKIHKKDQIWNEILYHCHKLKNHYMNKYSLNFIEDQYQNYYANVELKSTFPRRGFLIKFLPILNGLALIHEYIQIKLSSIKGDEKIYKECESIYGFIDDCKSQNDKITNNNQLIFLKEEPTILQKVNLFFVESLFVNMPSTELFNWKKNKNIYISQEIMNIIDRYLISRNNNNILKNIEKHLYKEYIEIMQLENNELELNSSTNLIRPYKNLNEDINDISSNEGDFYNKENYPKNLSFHISKNFVLFALFNKTNNKFINDNVTNLYSQKRNSLFNDNIYVNKKYSNSKKDINKFNEILNDNITDYIGTSNIYCKYKNEENNNSSRNNIFDSNFLFDNKENSLINEDYFNIDISIIEKKHRKYSFFKYDNKNKEFQKDKISIKKFLDNSYNKSNKRHDSYNSENNDLDFDYLGSKEEFFEGEIKNKVK